MRATLFAAVAMALALPLAAHAAPNSAKPGDGATLNERTIAAKLKQAGFTNIKVAPVVFIARATDKDGHPVLMAFRPGSVEAIAGLGTPSSDDQPSSGNDAARAANNGEDRVQPSNGGVDRVLRNNGNLSDSD